MKIGYFADGPWAHKALEKIVESNHFEIVFIVPRFDTQDPKLKIWADRLGVPFLTIENVNDPSFIEYLKKFNPDILVSMSFNQILKKGIIEFAPNGFINCHAGELPFYRGRNPLNWVLINGAERFGITVHYVDEGIDTGDIVEQKTYSISQSDNYASLLNKAIYECAEVLLLSLKKIKDNSVIRIKQEDIHPVGTYFGIRKTGDENIDFRWPAERLHNFIRAISAPGPGARFLINDEEYAVESAKLINNSLSYISTCGEVVGRSSEGVIVKAGDSVICITLIRKINSETLEPYKPNFRIGTRLKNKT